MLRCEDRLCHVLLRNATFEGCSLAAHGGAAVHLHGGWLQALPPQIAEYHRLFAVWGVDTSMHISGTTIDGDVVVSEGALMFGDCVHVRLGEDSGGVSVRGKDSSITLKSCKISPGPGVTLAGRVAVVAQDEGEIVMDSCRVQQVQRGAEVLSRAIAYLDNSRVDAEAVGLYIEGADSKVTVVGGRVSGTEAAVSRETDVPKANVSVKDCDVGATRTYDAKKGRYRRARWHGW